MQLLLLIPFFISCYYVARGEVAKAFLNVYIPCLLLIPTYWFIRLPHMPEINASSGAMIPIGIAVLLKPRVPWRFKRMDLWVTIFIVGTGLSETLREIDPKTGILIFVQYIFEMLLVYVVGRQLIEPDLRLEMIKRMIFCFVLDGPLALYEYRFGTNPYVNYGARIFGTGGGWFTQLRNGHARVASCFAHAILAGMLFVVAITLNQYLRYIYKQDKTKLGPKMSMLQRYMIPVFLLPLLLYLTGSRMPLACGVLCYLLLLIPRFKSMKTGVIVMLLIIGVGGGGVYASFQKYTSMKAGEAYKDEAQGSAVYRKELLINYAPVLEQGGWLGWGIFSFPRFPGQESVDNQYLIAQLGYGKLGKYSFTMLGIEAVLSLALALRKFQTKETQYLAFSLLSALVGIFVALSTVAIQAQTIQVTFLLLGWSQSLQDTSVFGAGARSAASSLPEPKFRFRRVFA